MKTLGEQVIDSLIEFTETLKKGDKIVASTIECCPCNETRVKVGTPKCHLCNGRGWIIDVVTLTSKEESD
jgi:hypothetical protein